MEEISREQFIERLEDSWARLIERFQQLPALDQRFYLEKQGYPSFSGLLGHIIAWWQDGARVIAQMRNDPRLPLSDYDMDRFNAQAIERFRPMSEAAVIQVYEAQRRAMVALVESLSDAELSQENIHTRLYYEIWSHWSEHELN